MTSSMKAQEEHSRVFYDYIRHISECKSKQEEDDIVAKDLKSLRSTLAKPQLDNLTMRECVTRIVYAEMLGHSAAFGHIHCVNLSSSGELWAKRVGYLSTWLCINPESELMYLIVANIQKDMKSSNFLAVSAALDAAARLLRPELMHALGDTVGSLLQHQKPLVRRKAVEAMHAFYVKSRGEVGDQRHFRQALTDRDPSVMSAAVCLLYDVTRAKPLAQKDLTDAFLSILSQVVQRRLARGYDYHHVPAPWLQIHLVRLLVLLVGNDAGLAKKCEPLFIEMMRRADTGNTIGFAVISEVVAAAAAMPPLPSLLELCAAAVDGCVSSRSPNIKYMGMKMLSQVASRYPALAAQHQETVMSCLEDPDETIRRRTITLLFAICNEDNIDPITHRIVRYLAGSAVQTAAAAASVVSSDGRPLASSLVNEVGGAPDAYLRRNITRGLCLVAERFAPSASWYIQTMNRILMVAPECVPYTTVQRMLKLIAEGQEDVDESQNVAFRTECVETYFALTGGGFVMSSGGDTDGSAKRAQRRRRRRRPCCRQVAPGAVPDLLNRVAAWVMGEYGFLTKKISQPMLMDRLCDMLERADDGGFAEGGSGAGPSGKGGIYESNGSETRSWIVTAMMKLAAQSGTGLSDYVEELLRRFQDSRSVGLQQRCYEFLALAKQPAIMRKVLPLDGCCEDLQVQPALTFLDSMVESAKQHGAKPFDERKLQATRSAAGSVGRSATLLPMDAYHRPMATGAAATTTMMMTTAGGAAGALDFERLQATGGAGAAASTLIAASSLRSRHGAKRWGAKDLEARKPEEAGRQSPEQQRGNDAAAAAGGRASSQAFHTDPVPAAPASSSLVGKAAVPTASHAKNAKFVKDIFGGSGGDSKSRRSRGIFGASPATAEQAQTQVQAQAQRAAAASSAMDDLFAPPPSTLPAAATAVTMSAPMATRAGTKQWGAAATAVTAPAPASSSSAAVVSMAAPLVAWETTRTVVTLRLSASPSPTPSCRLHLSSPDGVSWRLLEVSPRPGGAAAARGLGGVIGKEGVPLLGALRSASSTTTVDVELIVHDAEAFLNVLQTGAAAVVTVSVSSSVGPAEEELFLPPTTTTTTTSLPSASPLAQTTLTLGPADILRPVGDEFTTASFGQQWVKMSGGGETKHALRAKSFSFQDSKALRGVLSQVASLRVVEVIDSEWIAAARSLGPPLALSNGEPVPVLCHVAVTGTETANVTVRCPHAGLRAAVVRALSSM